MVVPPGKPGAGRHHRSLADQTWQIRLPVRALTRLPRRTLARLPLSTLARLARHRLQTALTGIDWRARRGVLAAAVLLVVGIMPAAVAASPVEPGGSRPTQQRSEAASDPLANRSEAAQTPARSTARTTLPTVDVAPPPQALAAAPQTRPAPEPEPEPAPKPQPSTPPKPSPKSTSEPKPSPSPQPKPSPTPAPSKPTPTRPAPIGGLTERQMEHAATIVRVGKEMGLPEQAYVVALATALQESYLRVLANPAYPESLELPNDGIGYDHDSVGLFQQRPSSGWGTVAECMDPAHSARSFYEALQRVPGWQNLPVTMAAQAVQVSAFPDAYAKHEPLARQLVAALA